MYSGKSAVSCFVEFGMEICSVKLAEKAFDKILLNLTEKYKTDFTRDNTALISFSKL